MEQDDDFDALFGGVSIMEQDDDFEALFGDTGGTYDKNWLNDVATPVMSQQHDYALLNRPTPQHSCVGIAAITIAAESPVIRNAPEADGHAQASSHSQVIKRNQVSNTSGSLNTTVSPRDLAGQIDVRNDPNIPDIPTQDQNQMQRVMDLYLDKDGEVARLGSRIGQLTQRTKTAADEDEPWPGLWPWEQMEMGRWKDCGRLSQLGQSAEEIFFITAIVNDVFHAKNATLQAWIDDRLKDEVLETVFKDEVIRRLSKFLGEKDARVALSKFGLHGAFYHLYQHCRYERIGLQRLRGEIPPDEPTFGPIHLVKEIDENGRVAVYRDVYLEQNMSLYQFLDYLAQFYVPSILQKSPAEVDLHRLNARKAGWRALSRHEDDSPAWTEKSDVYGKVFCVSPTKDDIGWSSIGQREFDEIRRSCLERGDLVWVFVMPEEMYQQAKSSPKQGYRRGDEFDFIQRMNIEPAEDDQGMKAHPYPPLMLTPGQREFLHAERDVPLHETWACIDEEWRKEVLWDEEDL